MDFAITLKPDLSVERIVNLARRADDAGFGYCWIFDSHVLWKEPFPLMTMIAANTKRLHIGPCVTNPAVRDVTVASSLFATLNLISGDRMELGIGRGDSSRRVLGKKPTTLADLEETVRIFRELNGGGEVQLDGTAVRFPWTSGKVPRVWVAGYGPKALRTAGKIGDGVILQFADPDLIEWCLTFVRQGAEEAGRDFSKIEVMAAAPAWVGDVAAARDRVRWFPALVSNHVVDLVSRYKPEELPPALVGYVRDRGGYDYLHHCEVGSDNANFVTDDVVDRFCLLGPPEAHTAKLADLARRGVTQFNIYLMCGNEEDNLNDYSSKIIPRVVKAAIAD